MLKMDDIAEEPEVNVLDVAAIKVLSNEVHSLLGLVTSGIPSMMYGCAVNGVNDSQLPEAAGTAGAAPASGGWSPSSPVRAP